MLRHRHAWRCLLALACLAPIDALKANALETAHHLDVTRIADALQLNKADWHAAAFGVDRMFKDRLAIQTSGYDAPPAARLSWASALLACGGDTPECSIDECDAYTVWRSNLLAWCAPTDDVPHLCACIGVTATGIELLIDYLPRADGAYDLKIEAASGGGEYEAPQTREGFTAAGVRAEYAERYFTPEAYEWRDRVASAVGAQRAGGGEPWSGPLHLHLRLPLDEASALLAISARAAAIERWLGWKEAAVEVSQMRRTMTFRRDGALREAYANYASGKLVGDFGYVLGQSLASAWVGPEELKYHSSLGQGSGGGAV